MIITIRDIIIIPACEASTVNSTGSPIIPSGISDTITFEESYAFPVKGVPPIGTLLWLTLIMYVPTSSGMNLASNPFSTFPVTSNCMSALGPATFTSKSFPSVVSNMRNVAVSFTGNRSR